MCRAEKRNRLAIGNDPLVPDRLPVLVEPQDLKSPSLLQEK